MLKLKNHVKLPVFLSNPILSLTYTHTIRFSNSHHIVLSKRLLLQLVKVLMDSRLVRMHIKRFHIFLAIFRHVRETFAFFYMTDGINTESINSFIQPPINHLVERMTDILIFPIQVRLFNRK